MKLLSTQGRNSTHGFTVTELLVVIVIIVIIAAISVGGMAKIRQKADKVNSTRNLSQLQLANASYSTDRNGNFVPLYQNNEDGQRIGFWYQNPDFLANLSGDVLDASGNRARSAPSSKLDPKVLRAKNAMYYSMAASYGMNDNGILGQTGPNVAPSHNHNRIPSPAQSMAFATATDYRTTYNSRFKWKGVDSKTSDGAIAYRYDGKALIVYFDGHVGEVSEGDMKLIDSSRGGKIGSFWKPTAE